jgi:TRAP transporter TAXI family solute receptor
MMKSFAKINWSEICGKIGPVMALLLVVATTIPINARAQQALLLSAGPLDSNYFTIAGLLCREYRQTRPAGAPTCSIQASTGSGDNIARLNSAEVSFGLVQSDWQYHAVNGLTRFEKVGPNEGLRAAFSLYPISIATMVRGDSDISTFEEVREKVIGIGPAKSGTSEIFGAILGALGWTENDFAEVARLPKNTLAESLCQGRVNATLYFAPHPSHLVRKALDSCPLRFVPMIDTAVEGLVAEFPYYVRTQVSNATYAIPGRALSNTFGLVLTVTTHQQVRDEVVYDFVRTIFDRRDALRDGHPLLAGLTVERMANDGLSAPLHPGALRYFLESGLLSE